MADFGASSGILYARGMRPSRVLALLPPAGLLSCAVTLGALWSRIPARWASHTGADGQPNGWSGKTPLALAFPLLVGAGIWLAAEAALWFRRTQASDEPSAVAVVATRLISCLVTGVFAYLSLALPLAHTGVEKTALVIAVQLTLGCVLLLLLITSLLHRGRQRDPLR